jgi:hypothetical protein
LTWFEKYIIIITEVMIMTHSLNSTENVREKFKNKSNGFIAMLDLYALGGNTPRVRHSAQFNYHIMETLKVVKLSSLKQNYISW